MLRRLILARGWLAYTLVMHLPLPWRVQMFLGPYAGDWAHAPDVEALQRARRDPDWMRDWTP